MWYLWHLTAVPVPRELYIDGRQPPVGRIRQQRVKRVMR
jgi:hypothetical protein